MASPALAEEESVLEALRNAYSLPVLYSRKAVVKFHSREMDSPLPRYTFSFQPGDYLHFKQPYGTTGWWVGRVVGERIWLGLLPSEEKLLAHRQRLAAEKMEERGEGEREGLLVYEDAPLMRPIVFLGPSRKDSELTELLQKALVSYMKEQFSGRLHTLKPQCSVAEGLTDKQAWALRGEVYSAGHTLNLVYLDCDASYHDDISWLHPLLIYVQVSRRRVLQRLVEELSSSAEERAVQLQSAYRLYEHSTFTPSPYSLVISDSDLGDACQSLELFLESYWAATRSVSLTPLTQHH
jgi:hypothetical protein